MKAVWGNAVAWGKRRMPDVDVLAAFFQRRAADQPGLRSDGDRLYSGAALIAQWDNGVIRIVSQKNEPAAERHKDLLVEFILWQMHRDSVIHRLICAGAKEGLHPRARAACQATMERGPARALTLLPRVAASAEPAVSEVQDLRFDERPAAPPPAANPAGRKRMPAGAGV